MKKIVLTLSIAFAACTFAVAQSNQTSDVTKATPVVNASDASEKSKDANCTPEMMKECSSADAKGSSAKSCCSSKSSSASSEASATPASSLAKEGDKAKTVSIGMSAKKPENKE